MSADLYQENYWFGRGVGEREAYKEARAMENGIGEEIDAVCGGDRELALLMREQEELLHALVLTEDCDKGVREEVGRQRKVVMEAAGRDIREPKQVDLPWLMAVAAHHPMSQKRRGCDGLILAASFGFQHPPPPREDSSLESNPPPALSICRAEPMQPLHFNPPLVSILRHLPDTSIQSVTSIATSPTTPNSGWGGLISPTLSSPVSFEGQLQRNRPSAVSFC